MVTSLLALGLIGSGLYFHTPSKDRTFLILCVILLLPMCALAFYCIRLPIDHWLSEHVGKNTNAFAFIRVFYAPLTEEPAKLWPLLIPWIYRRTTPQNYVRIAIAIGLGFGLGEAWTVAGFLAKNPAIAKYPWYLLNGFIGERIMVCFIHAGFTGAALHFIIVRRWLFAGIICAMLLHFLGNLPIYLAQQDFLSFGKVAWQIVLSLWAPICLLLTIAELAYFAYGAGWLQKLSGNTKCPGCGTVYQRPLFCINLFTKCYERCPACKHWHLVDAWSRIKE